MIEVPDLAGPLTRILIVDDDCVLCELIDDYLSAESFDVTAVHLGEDAIEALNARPFELVLLDLMLPRMGGLEVLQVLREKTSIPVVMMSAWGEDADRIAGLERGADDYLQKPFNPRELIARVRSILRRQQMRSVRVVDTVDSISVGPLQLYCARRLACVHGQRIELTGVEFRILEILMRQPGEIVSREHLTLEALGRRLQSSDRSINTHVSNIRRKIAPLEPKVSITHVRHAGYAITVSK